jgi:hypothetical protein
MTCICNGTGRLGGDQVRPCPCLNESANDALDRVTDERNQLAIANAELGKLVIELTARVQQLLAHRLKLLDALSERAHAMQQAGNLDGAKRLMAVVREVADG